MKSEPRPGLFLTCIPDTCLACQEILIYDMCPRDVYLKKLTLLMPTCQGFDKINSTTPSPLFHRTQQGQIKSKIEKKDLRILTTSVCKASKELNNDNNNFPFLKPEISDKSFNLNILPLPVKELPKSSENAEILEQEALPNLPDFDALFSLEENNTYCENSQIQPEIKVQTSTRQNYTTETIGNNGIIKCLSRSLSNNNNSIPSQVGFMVPVCPSRDSNYFHLLNKQYSPKPLQAQSFKPFWKNYSISEDYFISQNEPKKVNEGNIFDALKEKKQTSKNLREISSFQGTFSIIPTKQNSSPQTNKNHCTSTDINIDSLRNQNILDLRLSVNDSSKQFSKLPSWLISKREPVEHEERFN